MLSFLRGIGQTRGLIAVIPESLPIFSLPTHYPWTPDFTIFEHGDNSYSASYDPASDKSAGLTLTVDPASGDDDSGDGSSGAPYQSLAKAYTEGAVEIEVKSGWVDADNGFSVSFNPNRDLAITAIDGPGSVHLTCAHPPSALSWAQESVPNTNVYKAASLSSVRTALDLTYGRDGVNADEELQKDGSSPVPIPYTSQASIAAVQANAGSYYFDGADLYLHTHDSRAPDSDIKILKTENLTSISNDVTLYVEGVEIWADHSMSFNVGNTASAKFIGVDMACRFNGDGSDAFDFDDISDVRLLRCSASDNFMADGFNYHRNVGGGGARTRILEWNCDARRNGNDGSDNDNGTTTHDGVRCIRLNGIYEDNKGPNVADTAGAQVINLNCQSHNSLANNTFQRGGFLSGSYSVDEPAIVYTKNCTSSGNTFGRIRATGGQFFDLGGFTSETSDNGSVLDANDPFYVALGAAAPDAINGFYCTLEAPFFENQGGVVDDLFDCSPFKNNLSTPNTQPGYDASHALAGDQPVIDFGNALNDHIFDPAKSGTYKELIIACAYKDGSDASFDDDITFTANSVGGNKIFGASGTAALDAGGAVSSASINGASLSATVLPSGFAVYRFTYGSPVTDQQYFMGDITQSNSGWQGPVGVILTSKRDLTSGEFDDILAAIQTKFSIS